MVYEERNTWASLLASIVGVTVYAIIVIPQTATTPVDRIDWLAPMLWTIGGAIVAAIVLSSVGGILAGRRDRDSVGRTDERDRDIARLGERVGQAFLVLAGLGAIALCAVDADGFWVANVLFLGFALSAVVGGAARVIAYRWGTL